jgi:hypothetical protein
MMDEPKAIDISQGRKQLLAYIAICLFVWIWLLPTLGTHRAVKRWIEPLRARGINPSAMYYTDVFDDAPVRP